MPFDLSLQGLPLSCPVINVSNAECIEAVVRKETELLAESRNFVEIQQNPIASIR
jgi:hypothetical protein